MYPLRSHKEIEGVIHSEKWLFFDTNICFDVIPIAYQKLQKRGGKESQDKIILSHLIKN